MTDEELRVSLFGGQGRGGDKAKRSWMGVVYIMLILTLHISEIKHKSVTNFQVKPLQNYHFPIINFHYAERRWSGRLSRSRKGAGEGTAGSRRELA